MENPERILGRFVIFAEGTPLPMDPVRAALSLSEKRSSDRNHWESAADAKLEKTSLSAGGFQWALTGSIGRDWGVRMVRGNGE